MESSFEFNSRDLLENMLSSKLDVFNKLFLKVQKEKLIKKLKVRQIQRGFKNKVTKFY